MKKHIYIITGIFILAVVVRFLYFPNNVYFSYDQARDFYFAGDILKGDLRLIGPPSAANENLFAGPLSLYIYAIIGKIFGMDPSYYSIFFRLYNAFGTFLVYVVGSKLFNKKVGIIAAFFYAISYEQSQYSLLMSHQPLVVLTILLYYLGLVMFIFDKYKPGLILAALGLGLSIQLHFVYLFLSPVVVGVFLLYKNSFRTIPKNIILYSFLIFILTISTYLLSEFKFQFRFTKTLFLNTSSTSIHLSEGIYAANRFIHDLFLSDYRYTGIILLIVLLYLLINILKRSIERDKFIFLFLWLFGGLITYIISGTRGYYYSAAGSVSIILLFSYLLHYFYGKSRLIFLVLFLAVIFNNYQLIRNQNPKGPNLEIVIQPGMLLIKEKEALDYIYQSSQKTPFSVNALTVPLNVNTTWSYLFEWYGNEKYGSIPIWATKPAEGFPGNISYLTSRSSLPELQYVIIEPLNGIPNSEISKFYANEGYFSNVLEEKEFGTILVQKRKKI